VGEVERRFARELRNVSEPVEYLSREWCGNCGAVEPAGRGHFENETNLSDDQARMTTSSA
jgi:hypothetical protein